MAININNQNSPNVNGQQRLESTKQQALQSANNNVQSKQMSQDSVILTPQAKQLEKLQKKSDFDRVDQRKIDELKKAIASGDYKVDAQKLMANILAHEFDLFEG